MKKKVLFLDRDGTINKEIDHLYKIDDLEFIDGTLEAMKYFQTNGYLLVIITNQAGIAKNLYNEEDTIKLHNYMISLFKKEDIIIDYIVYCPHHINGSVEKYAIDCNCRKPKIGMIIKTIEYFKNKEIMIDLTKSIIIGDKEIDIETGVNAEIGTKVLVRSGHRIDEINTRANYIFDNLYQFYKYTEGNNES